MFVAKLQLIIFLCPLKIRNDPHKSGMPVILSRRFENQQQHYNNKVKYFPYFHWNSFTIHYMYSFSCPYHLIFPKVKSQK